MLKTNLKIVVAALMLSAAAMAQQGRIYQDAGGWAQEVSGSLAALRNCTSRVEAGEVRVVGGGSIGYQLQNDHPCAGVFGGKGAEAI